MESRPPTDPFEALPDGNTNACIGYHRSFGELSQNYYRSANALVDAAVSDRSTLDVHIYSICFLFRQCIELELKEDLWMTVYADTGSKIYMDENKGAHKKHLLRPIWDRLRDTAKHLLGSDFPLSETGTGFIEDALAAWERHDNHSYAFRYPISFKGGRTLKDLNNVNVLALRDNVHHMLELLGRVMYCVESIVEQLETHGEAR